MTPQEHQLLSGLFDRIRAQSSGARDPQAEAFIAQAVQAQPHAPYVMAQTVIVMEHTLQAANQRIQELEAQVRPGAGQAPAQEGSFLGNIGRSIFGGSAPSPLPGAPPRAAPPPQSYAPQQAPQPGPWGQQPQMAARGGGGFLQGALGAAAGVAGGVLLAESIGGLFGGHNNGLGGMFGGNPRGDTTVNNYYGNESNEAAQHAQDVRDDADADQDATQDAVDDSGGNLDTAGGFDSGGDSGTYDT